MSDADPPEALDPLPSQCYGKFVRVAKLGAGGMGEVWRAWDRELGRWVALKFLRGGDPEEIARFKREAQVAGRLTHPNICAIYEAGEDRGEHFIAMQYVEGETLKGRRERGEVAHLVRDAARAVAFAHERGVVHRDLKPDNLMAARGNVYVMDFGLARTVEGSKLSMSGMVVGTPAYMSPEQARGEKVDGRADVYSLGATLYELVEGRAPFAGPNVYEVLRKVQEEEPRRIDGEIGTIIAKAMEKECGRRYATARALAEDLDRWLSGEPIEARPATALYRLRKRFAKRRAVAVLGAVLAVVALAFAVREARDLSRLRAEEGARAHVEAGRRVVERQLRLRVREPDHTPEQVRELADRAIADFDRALAECPGLADAMLGRATALAISGRMEEALAELDRTVAAHPAFATAYLDRARLRVAEYEEMRHGEMGGTTRETPQSAVLRERVMSDLRAAERLSRDAAEVRYARGLIAFADGDYGSCGRELGEYLKSAPEDGPAHHNRAHALRHLGRFDEAVQGYTEAIRCNARNSSAWGERGIARTELGDAAAARADFDRSIEIRPNAPTHFNRGRLRWRQGDVDGAIADFTAAIGQGYGLPRVHRDRGLARAQKRDDAGAVDDFTRAIELDPAYADAYVSRALIRERQRDFGGMIADCTEALRIDPKRARLYGDRARGRNASGDLEGALADFGAGLAVDPESAELCFGRGNVLRVRGRHEEAIRDFSEAIRLRPDDAMAWHNRGLSRLMRRQVAEAIGDLGEALRLNPSEAATYAVRGMAYEVTGEAEKAVADCEKALSLAPAGAPFRADCEQRLARLRRGP